IVHPEFKEIVKEFYLSHNARIEEFPTLEFKVLSKTGKEIWVSQKASIRKSANNEILGYTAIARDITEIKCLELEKINRDNKLQLINEALNTLTFKKTKFEDQNVFINEALELTAKALKVNRIGFWKSENKTFMLKNIFTSNAN
ncbi:PAS domain S-box protein, partial [Arthrospira platensis SPKY1]|nr:PAS domain S-box protein [Arthrospira platensis SPKY1]